MMDGLTNNQWRSAKSLAELNEELSARPAGGMVSEGAEWNVRTMGKAAETLDRFQEIDLPGPAAEAAARLSDRAERLARDPDTVRELPSEAVAEFAWAAGRVVIGGVAGAAFAGPFAAIALQAQVAERVIDASIGGAVGTFANELGNKLTRTPAQRDQERYIAELERRLKNLERVAEAMRHDGDSRDQNLQRVRVEAQQREQGVRLFDERASGRYTDQRDRLNGHGRDIWARGRGGRTRDSWTRGRDDDRGRER